MHFGAHLLIITLFFALSSSLPHVTFPTQHDTDVPTSSDVGRLLLGEAPFTLQRLELRAEHNVAPKTEPSSLTTFVTPTLGRRAETTVPPKVIGYVLTQGVYSPYNCLTGTWYSVSGYGRCCPEAQTDCPVYTACLNGSVVKNDQYESTCTGTNYLKSCVTGEVFETVGAEPQIYVDCWPSWTGGDWKATRSPPALVANSADGVCTGKPRFSSGEIAAIVLGAIVCFCLAVGLGVFAARWYGLHHGPSSSPRRCAIEADRGNGPAKLPILPPTAALAPVRIAPLVSTGDEGLIANHIKLSNLPQRHDSAGTIEESSAFGAPEAARQEMRRSSERPSEVPADQTSAYEVEDRDVKLKGLSCGRAKSPYVDAPEHIV